MPGYKTVLREEEKEEIIKEFLPFIKYTAYRLSWKLPPHLAVDDLISVGLMGLMEALDNFEHGRVKFSTYAEMRIKGAMLDELRATDWVSRTMREKINAVNNAHLKLEKKLGRMPTAEEVAKALKISLDEYYKICQCATSATPISLEDFAHRNDSKGNLDILECLADSKVKSPLSILEGKDTKEILARHIDSLSEREKQVLALYYWNELTMKEIGKVLKMSESRVCQIHSHALMKLKAKLSEVL